LRSGRPTESPARSRGTRNAETPAAPVDIGAGARHDSEQRSTIRVGNETFRAVQHIASPSRIARVRTEAASEPASGSVSANDVTIAPLAMPGKKLFLRLGAEHQQALAADADIGAEHGTKCQAGTAELHAHQHLVLHREAEAAIFLPRCSGRTGRDPSCPARYAGGHLVGLGHRGFDRAQPLCDETPHFRQQLVARLGVQDSQS
jgi:hypothetical protein